MQEKRPLKTAYVMLRAFLCDRDTLAWGITGLRWPDGEEIQVRFEEDQARKGQPSFESLRTPDQQGRALTYGAQLRMPLYADRLYSGGFTTDSFQVLTYDQSESQSLMRFGHGHVRVFTPQDVSSKRHWLETSPQGRKLVEAQLARTHAVSRDAVLEELLAQALPGRERYRALCYLFNVDASMRVSPRHEDIIRDNLLTFFQQPELSPVFGRASPGYRPVKPYLLIRCLDADNRVYSSFAFKPSDTESVRRDAAGRIVEKEFLTPEACVEKLMPSLLRIPYCDVLPCMVYPFSMQQMRMGEGNSGQIIRKVAKMNRESRHIDDKGVYHPLAREMGIKLAPGGSSVIVESLFDQTLPACEPELLTRDNERYQRSPKPAAQEEQKLRQSAEQAEKTAQEERVFLRPHSG